MELEDILIEYGRGSMVLNYYKEKQEILPRHRGYICQAIVDFYHSNLKRKMNPVELDHEANRIMDLFNEPKVCNIIFNPISITCK